MPKQHSHRARDPQNAERFFSEHHDLLLFCAEYRPKGTTHVSVKGKELVQLARTHFGYAPTTASIDIMLSLMNHFRKRKRVLGPQGKS